MTPKVNLGFGLFIALIVPGGVLLFLLLAALPTPLGPKLTSVKNLIPNNQGTLILLGSLISVAIGLTLDVLRFLLALSVQRLARCKTNSTQKFSYDIKKMDSDEAIASMEWIIENHFRFHQFYGNMGLTCFVSIWLFWGTRATYVFLVLSIIFLIGAVIKSIDSNDALSERFPH